MIAEPLKAMTDDELKAVLHNSTRPIFAELATRGYRIRLSDHSASGLPLFIVLPVPRAVAE